MARTLYNGAIQTHPTLRRTDPSCRLDVPTSSYTRLVSPQNLLFTVQTLSLGDIASSEDVSLGYVFDQ